MKKTKWTIDPTHSQVQFKVKHLMITTVTGSFNEFESTVETSSDDFADAQVSFTAKTASVNTGNEQRDGHLQGDDFFNAEKYPELKFNSTRITKKDDENLELEGDLTIRDITKKVKLAVEFGGVMTDPWGNVKAGFTVTGKISRKEFGLSWNAVTEAGGVVVSDDVKIHSELQYIKVVTPETVSA
ncbi:MAG: polyisoprenoid-binding protein [Sphingobacteriales bacterium]|nr:MAG: polyisoprenoid-binding protein [Sphingobacteriales bacterium]